jgi:hypothetical protein
MLVGGVVVRVASSFTCQSIMMIMACIGADHVDRRRIRVGLVGASLGASQAPAKCPGRACPRHVIVQPAEERTGEADWKSSYHACSPGTASSVAHAHFSPSNNSLSKALFTLPTCARPARSLPSLTTTSQGRLAFGSTRLASSFRVPHTGQNEHRSSKSKGHQTPSKNIHASPVSPTAHTTPQP